MLNRLWTLMVAAVVMALAACSSSNLSDPKSVVIAMFGAMEKDDKATLAHLLDLAELMRTYRDDYALRTDTPRVFTNPEQILEDLTGNGLTKQRWFSYQRIINAVDVSGETATVEVTFMDKERSKAYLTRFGVHVVNGKWKIHSFKTTDGG
ncbi:MAG TPA: hypothetical protein VN285_12205 [Candidatus Deferrimicrobium sp.]|nr:hypothetical protein [Candidatus Deferrimicrobium sp.]